ncbi:MAG: hypothetical protein JNK15_11075, partial [Planctomycetes bacterium]|nr:hypothetical protein [Planctomycetota bacterium]
RLTPSITLATTVFTDFAETEDDGRQINLNRFPLFFPEKRDFFLEGGSYFTFGSAEAGGRRFQPFFTRRIGLAGDGTKIPLVFGSKVTGEAGPFEIGVIDVETDATATTERENLAVARAKYALGDRTTVGLIGTHGDPTSAGTNSVVGADFWHRAPEFVGDLDLVTTVDVVASTGGAGADDGESIGLDVQARGSEWRFGLGGRQVAADFRPALGFVSRRDTRRASATIAWQPRTPEGSSIRRHLVEGRIERGDAIDGEAQEAGFALERLGVELHGGDTIAAFASRTFERVDADFLLFRDSTLVARGDYWTNRAGVLVETSEGRPWNGRLEASTGDFFDGRSDQVEVAGEWRTSPLLHLGLDYESALVDLGPGRAFTTQVGSMRLDLHLDSDLSLRNLVQFDNESNVLGWQSRLRWNYRPGSDFFAVLGTAWEREADGSLVPTGQALEFKVVHTLRF